MVHLFGKPRVVIGPAGWKRSFVGTPIAIPFQAIRTRKMRFALLFAPLMAVLATAATAASAACTISPVANTADGVVVAMQQNGCRTGDIATVTSLPASTAASLIRRVCAFDRQIVVIPREPQRLGSIVDLVCVYSPR
jgi:hypothetical protein